MTACIGRREFMTLLGGAMLWQGVLQTARTTVPGDEVNFPAGALSVGLA
jgi:hypothetical protein